AVTVLFVLHVTLGGVASTTVTVNLQVLDPIPLVAMHVTLEAPSRKPVPLGGMQVTGTGPVSSEAVTLKFTGVKAPVHSWITLVRQVKPGRQWTAIETNASSESHWPSLTLNLKLSGPQ